MSFQWWRTRSPVRQILLESVGLGALGSLALMVLTQHSFEAVVAVRPSQGYQGYPAQLMQALSRAAKQVAVETSINTSVHAVSPDTIQLHCRAEDRELVRSACDDISKSVTAQPHRALVVRSLLSAALPDESMAILLLPVVVALGWLAARLYLRRAARDPELDEWQVAPAQASASRRTSRIKPLSRSAPPDEPATAKSVSAPAANRVVFRVGGNPFRADPQVLTPATLAQLRGVCSQLRDAATAPRVVRVVSGVSSRYAKTHVAAQLATLLAADTHTRVLLVEGDVDAPALHKVMRLEAPAGLGFSEQIQRLVRRDASGPVSVIRVDGNLHVLLEGRTSSPDALGVALFARILAELRPQHDFIIVDGPVIDDWPDSQHLEHCIDDVLMVAAAGTRLRDARALAARHFQEQELLSVVTAGDWEATG